MSQLHAKNHVIFASVFSSKTVTQRRTQSYDSDASDATEILHLSARLGQRRNGNFPRLDGLSGTRSSCILDWTTPSK